jgi:hypothetical protein
MSATGSRPAYTGEFEEALFNRVVTRYASNIPLVRSSPPRDATTPEERDALVDLYVWSTAHDLFIVQLAARAIDRLFREDPDFQLVLARRIGDDGAHAWASRDRIAALSGRDQMARVEQAIDAHWDRVGDIAIGSWQGFLAWELHFEHHILPKVLVRRRTTQIADLAFRAFAEDRIVPDEEFHRIKITEWWLRKLMRRHRRSVRNGPRRSLRRMRRYSATSTVPAGLLGHNRTVVANRHKHSRRAL